MSTTVLWWIGFNLFVVAMLAIDLGVLHRKTHEVKAREALTLAGIWIALAFAFCIGLYFVRGKDTALAFLTGYLIEESLSMDNVFVFYLIFAYFAVPRLYQHKVLFWGILGALIMRAIFIALGITLINKFHWAVYVLGAFLIVTGIKMGLSKSEEVHPENNLALKLFRKIMPTTTNYEGDKFFVIRNGRKMATPLFTVLLVVETTDIIFAVDSIPAILGVTRDPFIVYTSNVFAIMGLRSLYFAVAELIVMFEYLHYGLSVVLAFVGAKMLLSDVFHIETAVSLGVVGGVLALSILISYIKARQKAEESTDVATG